MRMNYSTNRNHRIEGWGLRALLVALLPLAFIGSASAQDRPGQQPVTQDEGGNYATPPKKKYVPIPVNPEVYRSHDEWLRETARKIENGTATTQERRAWYELKKRYYPFTADALPPRDWRVRAVQQGDRIDARLAAAAAAGRGVATDIAGATPRIQAAADYTWTQLGANVPWGQGQPPSATNTDFGAGRATAIWVNPNDARDVLLGFADGGIWKSTNVDKTENSATWVPLLDFQPSLSVGDVIARVSAADGNRLGPNTTIWVATGEGNFSAGDVQGVGVLKSTDGGASWQLKQIPWAVAADGTSMFDRTSIRRIAIDPRRPNDLWLAADSGVFRSNDAGETWRLVETLPYWKKFTGDCWYVHYTDLIIDDQTPAAGQPSHVYVANGRAGNAGCSTVSRQENAIFRSTDDGASWTNISVPNANCPGTVAGTASRGYSCVGSGFAASGLATSTTVNGNVGRISLAHSAANKKKIYALLHNVSNSQSLGIWSTNDASAATVSWTARATTNYCAAQCWYNMVGAVNPANDAQVIVGGLEAYVSSNSAGTINRTSSWTGWGSSDYAHADHHRLVWVDPTTVYLATDGGFNVGNVVNPGSLGGVDWVNQTYNLGTGTLQAYGMGQSAAQANRIHVGVQDNGQPKVVLDASNNITQWWEIRGGDGGFSATDRANDAIVYQEYVYGSIYRATNAAYTGTNAWNWGCIATVGTSPACGSNSCNGACNIDNSTQFIAPLMLDRNDQSLLYFGSRYVYRRNNAAGSWIRYSPDLTTTNNANSILWVHSAYNNGTPGRLWSVTENGQVWTTSNATCTTADCPTWTNTTKAPLPNRAFSWVESHPTDGSRAFVTALGWNTGHVFRTLDGGATWVDVSGELPNEPFDSIAVEPVPPYRVFVGSDFGVYVWEDAWNATATPSWIRINNGALPYQKVYELQWSPAAGGKLRAATHGRGIWELTIASGSACGGAVPSAPTGVTAIASSSQVTLSWNAVAGAVSYKVYRVDGSGCPASTTGRVIASGITGTTFTDTTSCTGSYAYHVVAMSAGNCESARSSCAAATVLAPSAPTGVTATPGNNQVALTWNAVAGASTYEVWRKPSSTCPATDNGTQIASNIAGQSYVDFTALNGIDYAYFVRVQTSCPSSAFSSCVTARPIPCTPPAAPATVTAAATGVREVTVTWSAVSGATSYKVYRADGACTAPDTGYTLIASGITSTSYVDTDDASALLGGIRYSYKIVTTTECDSALSTACAWAEAYGDCLNAPTFGGLTSATATAGSTCQTDLAWSAASTNCAGGGPITYSVYRSTVSGFTPSASTRLAAGVSGTTFADTSGMSAGVTYFYVVRAVDEHNNVEDANAVQQSAVAGPSCITAPLDVQVFTATASSTRNVLQWWNPPSGAPGTTATVNYRSNASGPCTFPTGPGDPAATLLFSNRPVTFGAVDSYTHNGITNGTAYCYAIWLKY